MGDFGGNAEMGVDKWGECGIICVSAGVLLLLRFNDLKTMRPAEIFKTRGIYNEEVIGNVPGAGHGTGTVQRGLGR